MWRRERFNVAVVVVVGDDVQRERVVERKVDRSPEKGCVREESGARRTIRSDEQVVWYGG